MNNILNKWILHFQKEAGGSKSLFCLCTSTFTVFCYIKYGFHPLGPFILSLLYLFACPAVFFVILFLFCPDQHKVCTTGISYTADKQVFLLVYLTLFLRKAQIWSYWGGNTTHEVFFVLGRKEFQQNKGFSFTPWAQHLSTRREFVIIFAEDVDGRLILSVRSANPPWTDLCELTAQPR